MTTEETVNLLKSKLLFRCELKAGRNEMLAHPLFKKMPASKDILGAHGESCIAHPIVLRLTQARRTDRTGTEIVPIIPTRRLCCFDQSVDLQIDRAHGKVHPVEIEKVAHALSSRMFTQRIPY